MPKAAAVFTFQLERHQDVFDRLIVATELKQGLAEMATTKIHLWVVWREQNRPFQWWNRLLGSIAQGCGMSLGEDIPKHRNSEYPPQMGPLESLVALQ